MYNHNFSGNKSKHPIVVQPLKITLIITRESCPLLFRGEKLIKTMKKKRKKIDFFLFLSSIRV